MGLPIPLPISSYRDQDPRASSKRLIGCFSEPTDQSSQADDKAGTPPIILRRAPGIPVFANASSISALIAAICKQSSLTVGAGETTGTLNTLQVTVGAITSTPTVTAGVPTQDDTVTAATVNPAYGYSDGTQGYTSAGSISDASVSGVGTVNVIFAGATGLTSGQDPVLTQYFTLLIVTGADSAPAQDSFETINVGAVTLESSSASYSTSGNTSTWSWVAYSSVAIWDSTGSYDLQFGFSGAQDDYSVDTGTITYGPQGGTPSLTAGYYYSESDDLFIGYNDGVEDLEAFGSVSSTALGSAGSNTFTLAALFDNYSTGVAILAITGSSSAPTQSSTFSSVSCNGTTFSLSAASFTTSGNTGIWQWTGSFEMTSGSKYTDVQITSGSRFSAIGYSDGTQSEYNAAGSISSQSIPDVGTLNLIGGGGDFESGYEFELIITGSDSAPAQDAFESLTTNGVTLSTSSASYGTSGNTATWGWSTNPWSDGGDFELYINFTGTTITPTVTAASVAGPYGVAGYSDGTGFQGHTYTEAGSIESTSLSGIGTINTLVCTNDSTILIVTGASNPPAQTSFASIAVGETVLSTSAASTFESEDNTSVWVWGTALWDSTGTQDVVFTLTGELGYCDGSDQTNLGSFGSITSQTITDVGTLNALYTSVYRGVNFFTMVITGESAAPAQDSVSAVSFSAQGANFGTSSAVYTTNGDTATWTWTIVSNFFTSGDAYYPVFTIGVATGYDEGGNHGGEGSYDIGSISGTLSFGTTAALLFTAADTTLWFVVYNSGGAPVQGAFSVLTISRFVSLQESNATYSTSGDYAIWKWSVPAGIGWVYGDEYPVTVSIPGTIYVGYDDGTDAGGEDIDAIGTLSGTVPFGTVNALEYFSTQNPNGTYNNGLYLVVTGATVAPSQYSFVNLTFKDNTGAAISLAPAGAAFTTDGDAGIWTWTLSTQTASAVQGFTSGSDYTITVNEYDYCGYDDGTGASGFGFGAFGTCTPATNALGTVNALEYTVTTVGSNRITTLTLAITGTAAAPDQSAVTLITFKDNAGNVKVYEGSAATYTTNQNAGVWSWVVSTVSISTPAYVGFNGGGSYNIAIDSPSSTATLPVRGFGQLQGQAYCVIGPSLYSLSSAGVLELIATGIPGSSFVRLVDNTQVLAILVPGTTTCFIYSPNLTATAFSGIGSVETGSNVLTIVSTTSGSITVGSVVSGLNIPSGTTIVEQLTETTYEMSADATGGTGQNQGITMIGEAVTNFQQLTDPGFTAYGGIDMWYCQGYLVWLALNGEEFINDDGVATSGTGMPTFTTAGVFGRSNGTDPMVGGCVDHLELMLFGTKTIEGFLNAGTSANSSGAAVGSPFTAVPSAFMEIGCNPLCGYTVVKQDQAIFWIASDNTVRRRDGQTPLKVSTNAIDTILQESNLAGSYGLAITISGHPLVVFQIPVPGRTLVYDCLSEQWWEMSSQNNNGMWRVLSNYEYYGKQLVGDLQQAQIGYLDFNTQTEWNNALIFEFTTQPIFDANKRLKHRLIELIATVGGGSVYSNGVAGSGSTTPKITLYVSDDAGRTYYARETYDLGGPGDWTKRLRWTNLGMARARVYKFRVTDPTPLITMALLGDIS